MAWDGFTIGRRLGADDSRLPAMVELMCDLLVPQA